MYVCVRAHTHTHADSVCVCKCICVCTHTNTDVKSSSSRKHTLHVCVDIYNMIYYKMIYIVYAVLQKCSEYQNPNVTLLEKVPEKGLPSWFIPIRHFALWSTSYQPFCLWVRPCYHLSFLPSLLLVVAIQNNTKRNEKNVGNRRTLRLLLQSCWAFSGILRRVVRTKIVSL